jgi:hypothetical protein
MLLDKVIYESAVFCTWLTFGSARVNTGESSLHFGQGFRFPPAPSRRSPSPTTSLDYRTRQT